MTMQINILFIFAPTLHHPLVFYVSFPIMWRKVLLYVTISLLPTSSCCKCCITSAITESRISAASRVDVLSCISLRLRDWNSGNKSVCFFFI